MPYKEDGSDVPKHVKGKKKRRQWAHVWNSMYQQTGDESRAYAAANSVAGRSKKLSKFGTDIVGYVGAEFGPFKCGTCKYSESLFDESICTNDEVREDESVPEDVYGNKLIEFEACCNLWEPGEER
jgi:hypothetical protein